MSYLIHLLVTVNFFVVLAIALDIVAGFAGLASLAMGAFFGVGAYSTAILGRAGFHPLAAQAVGVVVAALLSAVIALPAFRVRGIFLLIITIAVQIVFTVVAQNWVSVTGGDAGISKIAAYSPFGFELRGAAFLAFCTAFTLAVYFVCRRLMRSAFGLVLRALRDDEVGCAMLGKNVGAAKVAAFAFSGAIAAFAGSLYAHYTAYVDPFSFDLSLSILILLMVMLGGAGTLHGPVVGAIILSLVPEALKFLPLPPGAGAAFRQILFGALLLGVIFLRPQGIFGAAKLAPGTASVKKQQAVEAPS